MNQQINEERLKRYFSDNNHTDQAYIEKVFTEDNNVKQLKQFLEKQFNELEDNDNADSRNLDHIYYRIYYNITTKKDHRLQKVMQWTYRIAGIIFIPMVLFLGIYFYGENFSKDNYWVEIKAPAWTRSQFELPDGTKGWLNSNSEIRYQGNYIHKRIVTLNGEAYFNVTANPHRPFIVQTNETRVKVLGTKFNIASYENENNVEVVLEEGKLEFTDNTHGNRYIMKPNDLVTYNKKKREFNVKSVYAVKYTSWKEGKLVFRNDPMDVVTKRLERWYNVQIVNQIPAGEDLRWRATFEDEDLEKVLDIMKRTLPVDYTIEAPIVNEDLVYVKKKIIITLKQ